MMGQPERMQRPKPAHAQFQWDDAFLLELQLTEEERMIRDTARQYAQEKLLPRVTEAYLEEKTDREIFREMGQLGLIGVTFPEEYGCADAGYVAYGLVAREVARRFRLSLDEQCAVVAGDVSDLRLWGRDPAQEVSAETRERRM